MLHNIFNYALLLENMKKIIIISLGGSLIIPEKMNVPFLLKFVKILRKNYRTHKFVIVCGGGSIARKYIAALKAEGKSSKELANAGIRATRMNAMLIMQMFGKEANDSLLSSMKKSINKQSSKKTKIYCLC